MKKITLLAICVLGVNMIIKAQSQGKPPVEVTAAVQTKFKQEIEKEAEAYKVKLRRLKYSAVEMEFAVDTFKIESFLSKWIKSDYSDYGMSQATYNEAKQYDDLLNKYYRKLSTKLNAADKIKLVQAEKAWIAFRDNEENLIEAVDNEAYSGGTLKPLTDASEYLNLVKARTESLFSYYARVSGNE